MDVAGLYARIAPLTCRAVLVAIGLEVADMKLSPSIKLGPCGLEISASAVPSSLVNVPGNYPVVVLMKNCVVVAFVDVV